MKKEIIGYCAVDSGQILITDPCYLHDWKGNDFKEDKKKIGEYSYSGVCNTTLSKKGGGGLKFKKGHMGAGVAIGTAYGDGLYPVYVKKDKSGRILEATITFS